MHHKLLMLSRIDHLFSHHPLAYYLLYSIRLTTQEPFERLAHISVLYTCSNADTELDLPIADPLEDSFNQKSDDQHQYWLTNIFTRDSLHVDSLRRIFIEPAERWSS